MIHWVVAFSFAFTTGLVCSLAGAQTVRDEVVLLDKPNGKPLSTKLQMGAPIKILNRQDFWVEVNSNGKGGWLKASKIQFATAMAGATAIDTGRLGAGNIVSASAVRGLSAKDLVKSQPNFDEVQKLETLTVDPKTVQAFLLAGHVVALADKIQLLPPAIKAAPTSLPVSGVAASAAPAAVKKKGDDDW